MSIVNENKTWHSKIMNVILCRVSMHQPTRQWWWACIQRSRPHPHHNVLDPKRNYISWWTALHALQMAFLFSCHWHQCDRHNVSKGCTCDCTCDRMHALLAISPSQNSSCLKFCEILTCLRNSQLLVLIRKCNSCSTKLAALL